MSLERSHYSFEREGQPELADLLAQLGAAAEKVGVELAETDFIQIGPDDAMKLHGKIEMILSALAIIAGAATAFEATQSLFQPGPEQADAMRMATRLGLAAIGAGGAALMFKGFAQLEVGYKRLRGYIRIKELREPNE